MTSREVNQSSLLLLRVLEEVGRRQPASLGEVAAAFARPKTTIHRVLTTLHEAGWIRPTGHERTRWVLTPRVLGVARRVGELDGLRSTALPVMEALRDRSSESILLAISDGASWTVCEFVDGRRPVRLTREGVVGLHYPLYAGANGKVILAALRPEQLDRYLASVSADVAPEPDVLRADLDRIRVAGYAVSKGEIRQAEAAGVAAAVFDSLGYVEASISVALPIHRLDADLVSVLAPLVVDAARSISETLAGTQATEITAD